MVQILIQVLKREEEHGDITVLHKNKQNQQKPLKFIEILFYFWSALNISKYGSWPYH